MTTYLTQTRAKLNFTTHVFQTGILVFRATCKHIDIKDVQKNVRPLIKQNRV